MNTLSPRLAAAWALVGYAGLHLFFAFLNWVMPGNGSFVDHSVNAGFTDLFVMAMPVVAVLLAVHLTPPVTGAKTIITLALVEYVVSVVLGALALLIGLGYAIHTAHNANDGVDALRYVVMGAAGLVLIAVGGWITYQAFVRLGGKIPVKLAR
jgi:hypothetical protein